MDTFLFALILLVIAAVVSSAILWYLTKDQIKQETPHN